MKFIRALWGDISHHNYRHKFEIERASRHPLNEIVFVWGEDNEIFLNKLGYETIKISNEQFEYGEKYFEQSDTFFVHKLMAIKYGLEDYGEIIFLDWDTIQQKDIDDNFFDLLKCKNVEFQIPLYTFPQNYIKKVLDEWKDIDDIDKKYLFKHDKVLDLYNYKWNEERCVVNTSFVYCNSVSWINKIISINNSECKEIISDETPVMKYVLDNIENLENYIKLYEPLVCDAKFDNHFNQKQFKDYMKTYINKDLYFIHE